MIDEQAYLAFLAEALPVRSVHHVLDVGGATGAFTDLVRATWKAPTICHIFEPRPGTLDRFADDERVVVNEMAVADTAGQRSDFVVARDYVEQSHMRAAFAGDETITVAVTTVDDYLDSMAVACTLLKIDTEGYEPQVLAGAKRSIETGRIWAIQFEYGGTWGQGPTLASVTNMLLVEGFALYEYTGVVSPLRMVPEDLQYRNVLAKRP